MYLKTVDLFGFKTFAERTRFIFEPGISAIVGPNGSGKSNLVDAVRWVLGEQRARQLRGARMDEVIFAGNHRRRPLGMAEVSLTFDNSDQTLATPFAEVAVTRRVYRTGEGEYFINKAHVRLRDILDLLLGTGLGPDAAAIISQGEIDAILSAKPQIRREVFEEVAGTSRYQARKHEAQRRLEQTETNALRVNDVLVELDRQVPALEHQVRRAKRYRKLAQRLRDLEILIFVRKTSARRAERAELAATVASDQSDRAAAGAQRAHLEADAASARHEEYQATIALDERTGARAEKAAALQEIASAQAAAQARFEDTIRRCEALEREVDAAAKDVTDTEARVASALQDLAAVRDQRDSSLVAVEEAAATERAASAKWEAAYRTLRALEDRRAEAAAQSAQAEAIAQAAAAEQSRIAEEIARLALDVDAEKHRAKEERAEADSLQDEGRKVEAAAAKIDTERSDARKRREAAVILVERAHAALDAARADAVAAAAQFEARQTAYERSDGALGARAVLAEAEASRLSGIVGILGESMEVQAKYVSAIEAALGANAHAVVTRTVADTQAAIAYLKRSGAGRATFLPLDALGETQAPVRPKILDFISCAPEIRPAIEHLLADAIVVDSLSQALQAARRAPHSTVVTLDGELIRGAAIRAGSAAAESGPLAARQALKTLADRAATLQAGARRAQSECEAARTQAARAAQDKERSDARAIEAQLRCKDVAMHLNAKCIEADAAERRLAESQARLSELRASLDAAAAAARSRRERDQESGDGSRAVEAQRLTAAAEVETLQKHLSELRERHRAKSAESAALVERVAQTGGDVETARQNVAQRRRAHENRAAELTQARAEAGQGEADVKRLGAARADAEAQLERLESEIDGLRARRDELAARARDLDQQLSTARMQERDGSLELERRRIHLAEIDAELSVLQETFAQNPATDAECYDVTARYATYAGDAEAEIRKIREIVARMGDVNLNALEDHGALLERRDFLRRQLDDLEAARRTILASIAQIDAESVRQFNEVFDKVAAAFSETFAQLFDGGVGKMWLQTDAPDPTQAGIEIAAQPPGKKMQSLNLLSGGERALTAAALIFAIVKVRPSAFYLFDEIDAALDEANIGRFGLMLEQLSEHAQIIIITHNKATMTLADRIYGVTMGEPGISNVLSLALEQVGA